MRERGREWVTMLLAGCTGRVVVLRRRLGVNGQAFNTLHSMLKSHTHAALVRPPIAAILGSYYTSHHPLSRHVHKRLIGVHFTAKCLELTKGSSSMVVPHNTSPTKGRSLGPLVKSNWAQPTAQGKKYYKYMCLVGCACYIL